MKLNGREPPVVPSVNIDPCSNAHVALPLVPVITMLTACDEERIGHRQASPCTRAECELNDVSNWMKKTVQGIDTGPEP